MRKIIALSILLSGFTLVHSLNGPAIREAMGSLTPDVMGKQAMMIGFGIIFLAILSLILGPWLVQKKGWKFCVTSSLILGVLATALSLFYAKPLFTAGEQIFLTGLEYVWITPLIQMAFLSYEKKERLRTQGWVFLVAAPLLELAAGSPELSPMVAMGFSLAVFALMFTAVSVKRC